MNAFILLTCYLCINLVVQSQSVKQVIFTTGGSFGTKNNKVKFYTYNPVSKTQVVRDSLPGDFSNDVIADSGFAFVHVGRKAGNGTGDVLVKYNLETYATADSISNVSGLQKMFIHKNYLILTFGYGATGNYLKIYNKNNFKGGPLYNGADFSIPTSGVIVLRDTAYVSCTSGNTGKLDMISLNGTPKYLSSQSLDTLSKGISSLYTDGSLIYALAKNSSFPPPNYTEVIFYAGVTVYDPISKTFISVKTPNAAEGIGLQNGFLYANFGTGPGKFSTSSKILVDNPLFKKTYTDAVLDGFNNRFYFQESDYFSSGSMVVTDINGVKVDSLKTDISGAAIALDIRMPVGGTNLINRDVAHVNVYPNPAKDILYLDVNVKGVLKVFDISGREVMKKEMNGLPVSIDISQFEKGIYFLDIQSHQLQGKSKFIKE